MRRAERSSRIGKPRPIRLWLHPHDFVAALEAAGLKMSLAAEALEAAANQISQLVDDLLSALQVPNPVSISGVAQDLHAVERRGLKALRKWLLPQPRQSAEEGVRHWITSALTSSDNTVIVALLDTARAEMGWDSGLEMLAEVCLGTSSDDNLRRWAGMTRLQYMAGAERERRTYVDDRTRNIPAAVGAAFIASYVDLTGGPARFSRIKPEVSCAGHPTGPLIRYLVTLYDRLRARIAADPFTRHLNDHAGWTPSAETLAAWITDFRRMRLTQPRRWPPRD